MTDQDTPADITSDDLPEVLPILPLYDTVLFPKMVLPLVVMKKESVQLVDEAMQANRIIGLQLARKKPDDGDPGEKDLYPIGTSATILKMAKSDEDKAQLIVQGLGRFKPVKFISKKPYLRARVKPITDIETSDDETEALMKNLLGLFNRIVELSPGLPKEVIAMANAIQEPGTLADMIASSIDTPFTDKQKILEKRRIKKRLKEVTRQANHQLHILELGSKIQSQVKGDMEKGQREYY
ncbi:MAG: endopeptidase La, partial [Deltaproteobacteria bacterium]